MTTYRLGVDIGGTFTDIVLLDPNGTLHSKKVLSTPDDYSRAIEEGVLALLQSTGIAAGDIIEFGHGTTIATNAIIERKGVTVALVTTRGFRDVLELGRFRSPRLYDISFRKPDPLVRRRLRFEVRERVGGDGSVLEPVDLAELDRIADRLVEKKVEAVAICFINSYVNAENELAAQRHLQARLPGIPVSASAQLLPQIQEYERTSTTVVNAYIRPVVERYVRSLQNRMRKIGIKVPLMIMQSSGGVLPGDQAGTNPVYVIESGPAAGVVGVQRLGRHIKFDNLMVLDMGGTTAKASLIQNGEFTIMPESEVGDAHVGHRLVQGGGYAVQVPTIDIAEVGAGGGSIAVVDAAGGFHVGPQSAGAVPGPICYNRGGEQPTVTDANLILGYLNPKALVGGELELNFEKAKAAVAALGTKLKQSATDTAYGIHLIANANMMRALSGVSSERGQDPSRYALVAMGGNGGVHAGNLADTLRIRRIIIPPVAGLFSALGLLFADVEHQVIRGFYRRMDETTPEQLNATFAPMIDEAVGLLASEGFAKPERRQIELFAEMKYVGQTWTLRIPFPGLKLDGGTNAAMAELFGQAHNQNYGYRSDNEKMQYVALKVLGRGLSDFPRVPARVKRARELIAERGERNAYYGPELGWLKTPVKPRVDLTTKPVKGPLIVEEYDTTTVVRPGWSAHLDGWNNIVMDRL
ncbi:MAG: hydantoinase/oxoprolinase family protein [Proteobacteria bacterium]|nr:hydantoinase/oxoprolinase family protein [Pseudomonadota bacterium]